MAVALETTGSRDCCPRRRGIRCKRRYVMESTAQSGQRRRPTCRFARSERLSPGTLLRECPLTRAAHRTRVLPASDVTLERTRCRAAHRAEVPELGVVHRVADDGRSVPPRHLKPLPTSRGTRQRAARMALGHRYQLLGDKPTSRSSQTASHLSCRSP